MAKIKVARGTHVTDAINGTEARVRKYLPYRAKVLYVCPERELHQITLWVWLGWVLKRHDEMLVKLDALLAQVYNLTGQGEDLEKLPGDQLQ